MDPLKFTTNFSEWVDSYNTTTEKKNGKNNAVSETSVIVSECFKCFVWDESNVS